MEKVYVVLREAPGEAHNGRFVGLEDGEGNAVRVASGFAEVGDRWLIGPFFHDETGEPGVWLAGEALWSVYDMVTARVEALENAEVAAQMSLGAVKYRRIQEQFAEALGRKLDCSCPPGRWHAWNCRVAPGRRQA